ncbi:MAG: hypothetical protein EXQ52_04820 [Bryobacterales bacterium]|nr:hypothetical protein [Bryobacterales bacterium]
MKFLVDSALSPEVARLLGEAGLGLHAAEDSVILERASVEERVAVSADSDFAMLLALSRRSQPSFILFREAGIIRARNYACLILENLPSRESELDSGYVVAIPPQPDSCTEPADLQTHLRK